MTITKEELEEMKEQVSPREDLSLLPEGSMEDIDKRRDEVLDLEFAYDGKRHCLKYKLLAWITENQVIADASKRYQGATATEYERAKQEKLMKLMVVSVDGKVVDNKWWAKVPFDFGETVRFALFGSNGEMIHASDMIKNLMGKSGRPSDTSNSESQMLSED